MNGAKSAARVLLVLIFAATLAAGGFACPLETGFEADHSNCPHHRPLPQPCPLAICQASSAYVTSQVDPHLMLPAAAPVDAAMAAALPVTPGTAHPVRTVESAPPGKREPLFLRDHSFLI